VVAHADLVEDGYIPSFELPKAFARELYGWLVEVERPILGGKKGEKSEFDALYDHEKDQARSIFTFAQDLAR